ncbi:MAG: hypothetical protein ACHQD9_09795 [Chitinophagales bacterium]
MKKMIFLLLILSNGHELFAQDSLNNIIELQQLLKQRKDQFDSYAVAADQRSGIFGNKTKKDLEKSREILLGMVKIDNKIMDKLGQTISTRGMAKADYSVDEMGYQQRIKQLTLATDTLYKQLVTARENQSSLQKKITMQQVGLYFLGAMFTVLLILFFVRRNQLRS